MKRIESIQNSLVKHWKKLVLTRKERDKSKEFLVEGFHSLIVREGVELPANWNIKNVEMVEVNQAVAKEIAETEQSQGVFAYCRQPEYDEEMYSSWTKLLLIDSVQDPGNVGTMIRTADAAGMDAVILGQGSADPYNPKTVRAAQGSNFNIPVVRGDLVHWVQNLKAEGIRVLGTGFNNASYYTDVEIDSKFALIVGNEGSGVSPELLALADKVVKIPLYGKAESLNVAVATGILLYAYATK
jgi:RNA methyltransferase, TrmH family